MTHLLVKQLERDIRNQVVIDQMKKLNWKGKLMVQLYQIKRWHALALLLFLWIIAARAAFADDLHVPCPTPGETCKVLILTPMEEKILMQPNGILDTAAQARNLDLGQFSVYLKTRISSAPAGEVVKLPETTPKADKEKPAPAKPVDNPK